MAPARSVALISSVLVAGFLGAAVWHLTARRHSKHSKHVADIKRLLSVAAAAEQQSLPSDNATSMLGSLRATKAQDLSESAEWTALLQSVLDQNVSSFVRPYSYNLSHPVSPGSDYNGIAWPAMDVEASAEAGGATHVFAIGDWGALLPNHLPAPNHRGAGRCPKNCDYVTGIDDRAQQLVANQMKARAGTSNPQYVLNAGDSFYWGGVTEQCGAGRATGVASGMYAAGWQSMYGELTSKPWIGTLGNHDYGGWQFNKGWDQIIGYSFVNSNWVLPARYFSRVMQHPGYTVEYFVIDSNAFDAQMPDEDPEHNICSAEHNPSGADCSGVGGPSNVAACRQWFWDSYHVQQRWLQQKLAASTATWKVVLTHFPCGHDAAFYATLHQKYGLDLLVTGHRHQQELWSRSGTLGGLTCFVTGGGGGVTSERPPVGSETSQYGFFDLTFTQDSIKIELVNLNGLVLQSAVVTH